MLGYKQHGERLAYFTISGASTYLQPSSLTVRQAIGILDDLILGIVGVRVPRFTLFFVLLCLRPTDNR